MKILVALSGGIDSSTAAFLLHEQGHELIGVRFTLWNDPLAPPLAQILPSKCCNAQAAARAQWVARDLAIPYHVVNLEEDFKRSVIDPFLEGYRKGLTPNPCIRCNREIKFGKLLELMEEFGCERMATGHYARVAVENTICPQPRTIRHLLLEAIDPSKDQSYYLYGLTQEQLSRATFPLGSMMKSQVYALATHFGIPFDEEYRESQDLCFFPEKEPKEFLRRHLRDALTPGSIVRRDGTVVGSHGGLPLYTIGQRRGLCIGGLTIPLEIVAKDQTRNALVVAPKGEETVSTVTLSELRWISWKPRERERVRFESRTRSLSPRYPGTLTYGETEGTFSFENPRPPQAPGQSLVLYRSEEVVGGGVIV